MDKLEICNIYSVLHINSSYETGQTKLKMVLHVIDILDHKNQMRLLASMSNQN